MTDVRNDDFTLIHSIDDVIPLYAGNGAPLSRQRIGFETEICLYRKGPDGKPVAATSAECSALLKHLENLGHKPQLEMASAIEYASPAFRVTEVALLSREIAQSWESYIAAIRDFGLIPSDGALLPFVTLASAKENLVDRDRARGLVKGMELFKAPELLKVTLLSTSTQVSISYRDADDLYETLTTGYALQPAIIALFANHPAYIEGNDTRIDFNPRAKFYEAFGKDGGIPESILTAKNGHEFIRNHARHVFDTEMIFYYDRDKRLVWPEKPVRFRDLSALGLNTRSNYDLAETFVYTDYKICNIRDENGVPTGKRVEVRGFDAGELGVQAAVPFVHALLRDEEGRAQVQGLLLQYGIAPDLPDWKDKVLAARHAAANHGGKYLDVPFGNGTLKAFCRELGVILGLHAQKEPQSARFIAPLREICDTGLSVAEKNARAATSYDQANKLLFSGNADNDNTMRSANLRAG